MLQKSTQAIFRYMLAYLCLYGILFLAYPYMREVFVGWGGNVDSVVLLFIGFVLQQGILVSLLICVWRSVVGDGYKQQAHLLRERRQWKGWSYVWTYVVGGLLIYFFGNAIVLGVLTSLDIQIPGLYGEQLVMQVLQGLDMTTWRQMMLVVGMVVIIGPIIEEIIFRGAMTHSFMKEWGGKGVVLAALVFATVHTERAVVWNLVILSLCLGYIYRKTESLRYSFLFHVVINGLAMLALLVSQLYPELLM